VQHYFSSAQQYFSSVFMQHKAVQCQYALAIAWGASLALEAKLFGQANKHHPCSEMAQHSVLQSYPTQLSHICASHLAKASDLTTQENLVCNF